MKNKVLFMMVAILAMASNIFADNGIGTLVDNGIGTLIDNGIGTIIAFINGIGT
jgi:hypothetical protein